MDLKMDKEKIHDNIDRKVREVLGITLDEYLSLEPQEQEKLIKEKTGKDLVYRRFLDPHIVTAEELDRRAEKSIGKTGKMFKKISSNTFQNQAKRLLKRKK